MSKSASELNKLSKKQIEFAKDAIATLAEQEEKHIFDTCSFKS